MNILVGIVGNSPGWEILLTQEGVPFARVNSLCSANDYSVVVAGKGLHSGELDILSAYLSSGGAVLCSTETYAALTSGSVKQVNVPYLWTGNSPDFQDVGIVRLHSSCSLLSDETSGISSDALVPREYVWKNGIVLAVPFDAGTLITDTRCNDFSFYAPFRRLPFERVSVVSKHTVRRLVSRALEFLHHKRTLPYIHTWYYPKGAPSVFSLRIDTDGGTSEEVKSLFVLLHRHHLRASWFLDLETQEALLPFYKTLEGHEVGIHCYHHQRWKDERSFRSDLARACDSLTKYAIVPKSFAAPYGEWHSFISTVLLEAGFEYSSEFSYDYDNLPSVVAGNLLQVPIHPICIGSMKRHSYTDDMMKQYFTFVVKQKLATNEPLIFYHHPRDGREGVLEHLLTECKQHALPAMTMGEFARWWKERISASSTCITDGTTIHIKTRSPLSDLFYHITLPDGRVTLVAGNSQIAFGDSSFHPKTPAHSLPSDVLRVCEFNYRIPLIRGLDACMKYVRKVWKR